MEDQPRGHKTANWQQYYKNYYNENKDKHAEYMKKYRQEKKEELTEYRKKYYQNNKEKFKASIKKYCDVCDKEVTQMSRHITSKKHIRNMEKLNI